MGQFLSSIGKLGLTSAATAAGGPLGGAAAAGGMNALESVVKGGDFYDMLGSGALGAGGAYLGGKLAAPSKSFLPEVPNTDLLGTLDQLNFNPKKGFNLIY